MFRSQGQARVPRLQVLQQVLVLPARVLLQVLVLLAQVPQQLPVL